MFPSRTSVCQSCHAIVQFTDFATVSAIGFTKISFVKRTPNSLLCHSRNFPLCYSTHVPSFTNGATITNVHLPPSCNIRHGFRSVVLSCSILRGRRCVSSQVPDVSNQLLTKPKCVLVKGWKSSSGWGFPKGKINEVEPPPDCAIREVGS